MINDAPHAKYTMTYREAVDIDPTCQYLLVLDTEVHTAKLREIVMAVWWDHEIAGETLGEFKAMLTGRLNRNRDYWIEYINAYETKINMLDGAITTTTREDSSTKGETGSSESKNSGNASSDSSTYDLPRSIASENRPSGKESGSSTNSQDTTASYKSDVTSGSTSTMTIRGGESVISLKSEYLKLLRNAWEGFAMSFAPCFLDLFA